MSASAKPPARSGAASAIGWVLTIGLNVVAPILTYNTLTEDRHWSEFSALLLSSASATYATPHTSVIVRRVERNPSYCHLSFHQAVLAGVPSVANLRPK